MAKHAAPRVSETNLVRYYGFKAPAPAPQVLRVQQPITVRRMRRTEEATSGIADIVLGTVALIGYAIVGLIRLGSWIVRAVRRRT